jgi:hypothetical protein
LAALLLAMMLGSSTRANADPPRPLADLARELGSGDEPARNAAIGALRALPEDRLPDIRARLARLRLGRPAQADAVAILNAIRRATGSRRADDLVDIAEGVPAVLRERRDRAVLSVVEPLLLLRSLEALGSPAALSLVPEVLRLDRDAWSMEGRRVTLRAGARAAGAVIRARSHEDAAGRDWSKWSMSELGVDEPGRSAARLGAELPDVVSAWAETRWMDAMPVVASLLADSRRPVREAAREAMRTYGQNGIWQTREQFRVHFGEQANPDWSWRRTLDELLARLDARESEDVRARMDAAGHELDQANLREAERLLDEVLRVRPTFASPELTELWMRLGDARFSEPSSLSQAERAYRRALRLSRDADVTHRARARLEFIEAERQAALGVVDLAAYRRAADQDASCARCQEVRQTLETLDARRGAAPASGARWYVAAIAFAVLGALLTFGGKTEGTRTAVEDAEYDPEIAEMIPDGVELRGP